MKTGAGKKQYLAGARAGIPVVLGFIPVGIAYAIMARQAGFSILQTCGMSAMVFAGASQMMAVGMTAQGAGIITIILATFILNLRHLIMSTCVINRMPEGHLKVKLLAAFGVTDESFAIFTTEEKEHCTIPFFLGLITVTYLSWNVGTLLGAVTSDFLPEVLTASLGIALYAMFIGLLVPGLSSNGKLGALVVLTAVCNTILSCFMDSS
ncbi:MAG: AzlC family ABC transporter permease, partial [Eubacteriales bacterium]|nr:AzlC family ABC transporter permease [Eubacteriales bacterium]